MSEEAMPQPGLGPADEEERPPPVTLTLSGGGFRATFFHLGVLRYLAETGRLRRVRRVIGVSGGSIVAAHLVDRWSQYVDAGGAQSSADRRRRPSHAIRSLLALRHVLPWAVRRRVLPWARCALVRERQRSRDRAMRRPQDGFARAAADLVSLAEFDVRGRILRRLPIMHPTLITSVLLLVPMLWMPAMRDPFRSQVVLGILIGATALGVLQGLMNWKAPATAFRHFTPTGLLAHYYDRALFNGRRLQHLKSCDRDSFPRRPDLHILATDLTTMKLSAFSVARIAGDEHGEALCQWHEDLLGTWRPGDDYDDIRARRGAASGVHVPEMYISTAVAASSAFPGMFPPVELGSELTCIADNVPNAPDGRPVSDGGLFDNIGARATEMLCRVDDESEVIYSDASAAPRWLRPRRPHLISVPMRAADVLTQQLHTLHRESPRNHPNYRLIDIVCDRYGVEAAREAESPASPPSRYQLDLRDAMQTVRTDFDHFAPHVIEGLVRHGYLTAQEDLDPGRHLYPAASSTGWRPGPKEPRKSAWPQGMMREAQRKVFFTGGVWRDPMTWVYGVLLALLGWVWMPIVNLHAPETVAPTDRVTARLSRELARRFVVSGDRITGVWNLPRERATRIVADVWTTAGAVAALARHSRPEHLDDIALLELMTHQLDRRLGEDVGWDATFSSGREVSPPAFWMLIATATLYDRVDRPVDERRASETREQARKLLIACWKIGQRYRRTLPRTQECGWSIYADADARAELYASCLAAIALASVLDSQHAVAGLADMASGKEISQQLRATLKSIASYLRAERGGAAPRAEDKGMPDALKVQAMCAYAWGMQALGRADAVHEELAYADLREMYSAHAVAAIPTAAGQRVKDHSREYRPPAPDAGQGLNGEQRPPGLTILHLHDPWDYAVRAFSARSITGVPRWRVTHDRLMREAALLRLEESALEADVPYTFILAESLFVMPSTRQGPLSR